MNIEKSSLPIEKLRQQILEQLTDQVVTFINNNNPDNLSNRKVTFSKEEMAKKVEAILQKNPTMTIQDGINAMNSYRQEAMDGLKHMSV